jgi:uncharacterized membrane protein
MVLVLLFLLFIVVILCDLLFFYFVKDMFNRQIMDIQGTPIVLNTKMLIGSLLTYILIVSGFYKFIILGKKTWWEAFLLGFVVYGIYEMTNYALFSKWRWTTAMIDTLWGGVLFTLVFWIHKKYLSNM